MQQTASGDWRRHPFRTEQVDWAEFVTQALTGAAANVGSIEAVLAGRPGSWEADEVRNLLLSAVGYDEAQLLGHRTEPLRLVAPAGQILAERGLDDLYDASQAAIGDREQKALGDLEDTSPYLWYYERTETGEFVSPDPQAHPRRSRHGVPTNRPTATHPNRSLRSRASCSSRP